MSDILAALAATEPGTAGHRCKIGRWLDSLADQPHADELVAAFETKPTRANPGRTMAQLAAAAARLGEPTSQKTIGEHRRGDCRCSW